MSELLRDLLKNVSRSFYITLRMLPPAVRPQISLAYLLARTTDTIADTDIVPLEQRLKSLRHLRERILGTSSAPLDFGELARHQGAPAERALLEQSERSLALLKSLSEADQEQIRNVLQTIIGGQELDLQRFGRRAESPQLISLQTHEELDDYTYRVAGCVGEFWTKMCRAHLFPRVGIDDALLVTNGISFGKGLQLINILRDLPVDLRNGRCYLPAEELTRVGLSPADLANVGNETKLRPVYDYYLDLAATHLAAGWEYTHSIPRDQRRIRIACALPILIGTRTIRRLRSGNILDSQHRIKITRGEVRWILFQTIVCYPFPARWHKLFP